MVNNKIQFAVVREDPQIEVDILSKFGLKSAALIGSGGCSAFSIKAVLPKTKICLIEPNPAQVQLIKQKIKVLKNNGIAQSRKIIATNKDLPMIEHGNFESLFKLFREFIYEFILPQSELKKLLKSNSRRKWNSVFKNTYWDTAFDMYFSNSLLVSMFGPEAIQYAPRNSYPKYFKTLFEKGLVRTDAKYNYFLHHVFLGSYFSQRESLPTYLQKKPKNLIFRFKPCLAHEFQDYNNYDLISLSNILDWSSPALVKKIAKNISNTTRKGSVLVYRQLNNNTNFKKIFKQFKWQEKLEQESLKKDRSLFYSKICIGVKNG